MLRASHVGAPSEIADKRLLRLYEYWVEKRAGRCAPARRNIDPAEIPDLLGFVNMFDVLDDPRDYRVRLNGTEVAEMLGQEITGRLCSSVISGEDAVRCKTAFDMCVDDCQPTIVETSMAFCGKPHMAQTIIVLPLSSDGEKVDTIVTAHSYHYAQEGGHVVDFDQRRGAQVR